MNGRNDAGRFQVERGPEPAEVAGIVRAALDEDFRYGPDVTTLATIPPGTVATAAIVSRQTGVLCGVSAAREVLRQAAPGVSASFPVADGARVDAGTVAGRLSGPLGEMLGAERTMLNFLTHLSGIATATRAWADAIAGTPARVRDTRKTLPGLRILEKYAVTCGGGVNHRMGLGDAALIKDNHVAFAGSVSDAFHAVRDRFPDVAVEVECDTLEQVRDALKAGASMILLDNMSLDQMRESVAMARGYPGVALEASGGLTLASARKVALTGVDYLAVGALTHSSPALDLGLDL